MFIETKNIHVPIKSTIVKTLTIFSKYVIYLNSKR